MRVSPLSSCRNRHCPKCQGGSRERWLAAREADLLPVPYFHVVFTVPAGIAAIAFHNKAVVYGILFDAVAATLKTIASDPQHLGGERVESDNKLVRKAVVQLLKKWIESDILKVVEREDRHREKRKYVEVGDAADEHCAAAQGEAEDE